MWYCYNHRVTVAWIGYSHWGDEDNGAMGLSTHLRAAITRTTLIRDHLHIGSHLVRQINIKTVVVPVGLVREVRVPESQCCHRLIAWPDYGFDHTKMTSHNSRMNKTYPGILYQLPLHKPVRFPQRQSSPRIDIHNGGHLETEPHKHIGCNRPFNSFLHPWRKLSRSKRPG